MPDTRSDFYVYVLFRPNGSPCYVGKGCGRRWESHETRYRGGRSDNRHLTNIIAGASGVPLPKIKIREGLSRDEALQTEIALIRVIGRKKDGGPLVNMTEGGDGMKGHNLSEEHKTKIGLAVKGMTRSEDFCKKIGDRRRGVKATPETLEKQRLSHLGKKQPPEVTAKIAAKNRGKKRSAEFVERIIRLNTGRKRSPETRAKLSEVARNRVPSHDTIMKHSRNATERYSSLPERQKLSERMRVWWADRKAKAGVSQ